MIEPRSVLAKKKAFKRDRINQIEDRIARKTTVTFPDASDIVAANQLQLEILLYPMNTLILTSAESVDCPLVSFDVELVEHGTIETEEFL